MADLTAGEAARLDKMRGKAKSLTLGTRIRNLELMTDPALASQIKVVATEAIAQYNLVSFTGWDSTNSCFSIHKADANSSPVRPAHAYAPAAIDASAVGYVSTSGYIAGNTSSATDEGDPVYLSDSAGGWSLTASTTTIQQIGTVALDDASGYIAVSLGPELLTHDHSNAANGGVVAAASGVTDLDCGASGTAGTVDIFPTTASRGRVRYAATDNTGDDIVTVTGPVSATAGDISINLPNIAGTLLHSGTQDQSINGDLALGASGTEGTLTVYPTTASKGNMIVKAQDDSNNKVTTLQNAATTVGASCTLTLPTTTGYVVGNTGNVAFDTTLNGDLSLGASGTEGILSVYPATTSRGRLNVQAGTNTGDDIVTLIGPGATGGNITLTLPAVTGTLLHSGTADQSINGDLQLGADGVAGTLTLYPLTSSRGTVVYAAGTNTGDDVVTVTGPSATSGNIAITLPSVAGTLITSGTADQSLGGDLQLGADAVEGLLTLYPATTNSGTFVIQATDNTGDDIVTLASPGTATGGNITITLPNVTGTLLHSGTQDQAINGDLQLGADGVAGTLTLYPLTASRGSLVVSAGTNTGDDVVTLVGPAATGAAATLTLPNATGYILGTAGNVAADTILGGDLQLGADAVEGLLTLYPTTTNSGTFVIQATDNTGDDIVTLASPGTATGGNITITLPNTTGTLLTTGTNPAADITLGGDLQLGADGTEGLLTCYPGTSSKGTLVVQAVDNAGDDVVTLKNHASTGAAVDVTLPAFTGNLMVYESTQRFIPLTLVNAREVSSGDPGAIAVNGGILASDTTPILEAATGGTDNMLRINWANTNTDVIAISTALPPDFNPGADLVLHLRATTGGATDTFAITVESWFNEGDTVVSDATGNVTQNGTYSELTATIANADIPAGAQTVTFNIYPAAHANDALLLNAAAWLEYTGLALTS